MNLPQTIDKIKHLEEISKNLTCWHIIPPKKGEYCDFPQNLTLPLKLVLEKRGIKKLYSHQATAIEKILKGENVVIVTPTASGKTLCYNLPVLNEILKNPQTRALYLFPTKALSQDQVAELYEIITDLNVDIKTYTFDGDTPASARQAIRTAGHIVVTNPDMLHTGILPYHTKWLRLFENLKYVIIDEVHHYRGVFGSHFANVIRRLKRICQFYGSKPTFILCSATIANPGELAKKIIEEEVTLVDNNGAPSGERHILLYNPPVVNKQLGIRKSSLNETDQLASLFLKNGIQTIVFARSRLKVEVLLTHLTELLSQSEKNKIQVRGYRGGYLPTERREIEKGIRSGQIKGVVSTNALELGIDIGQLEVSILCSYPGNIASTWQQIGRAGRKQDTSLSILVANSSPLDQYIIQNPAYFFSQTPEHGVIDPNNLIILISHLKCAAFELPFKKGEKFGVDTTEEMLNFLQDGGILHFSEDQWHWTSEIYPAEQVSLRSSAPENFVILNTSDNNRVIGEVDYFSAPIFLYPDAIYLHEGEQYQIEKLDWEGKKAYAKEVKVDYYTDCETKTDIKVLRINEQENIGTSSKFSGEVSVTTAAVLYKKIKFQTHENVGSGRIYLPEQEMQTQAFWFEFPEDIGSRLKLSPEELAGSLRGLAFVLGNVACLWVMCDPRDLSAISYQKSIHSDKPAIYIYDNHPGGVGFSEKIFHLFPELVKSAIELIEKCICQEGCPSCVSPKLIVGEKGKTGSVKLASWILGR